MTHFFGFCCRCCNPIYLLNRVSSDDRRNIYIYIEECVGERVCATYTQLTCGEIRSLFGRCRCLECTRLEMNGFVCLSAYLVRCVYDYAFYTVVFNVRLRKRRSRVARQINSQSNPNNPPFAKDISLFPSPTKKRTRETQGPLQIPAQWTALGSLLHLPSHLLVANEISRKELFLESHPSLF